MYRALMLACVAASTALAQAPADAGLVVPVLPPPVDADAGEADAGEATQPSDGGAMAEGGDAGASPLAEVVDAGLPLAAETATPDAVPTLGKNQKLPKNFSGVIGRVTDAKTGEGLIEATIKVVAGGKKSALTDLDGYYRLKLPPGTYDLRVFYELYEGRRISNVVVKKGEAVTLDVALESDARSVQEVVVEAKADKRNETALLQERKKAAVVMDSIGAQEIARTPDSNAGDAVKRVVSATIVDDRYVYLRGLGGRYAQTLLNGTLMPSPEPDEPSVPMDLFPVALLSNLNVLKTYSPELPASFGGGSLTLDTNTFPTKLEVKANVKLASDSVTLGQPRASDTLSLLENFGLRDGARDLPSTVPNDGPLTQRPGFTAEQQKAAGDSFRNAWDPSFVKGLPSMTLGAQVGNSVRLGKDLRLGYLFAAQLARNEQVRNTRYQTTALSNGELIGVNQTSIATGRVSGSTSALANVGLKLSQDNEVSFLGLYLVNSDSTATNAAGYDLQSATDFLATRLQFTQRQLFFNQVKGFHRLPVLHDAEIDWQANYARVNRNEPDIRDMRYFVDEQGVSRIRFQPNSAERFYLDLAEDSGGATFNVTVPVKSLKVKLGGLGQYSSRTFDGRRLRMMNGRLPANLQTLGADALFVPGYIGPKPGAYYFTLEETTLTYDRYDASLGVWGGYVLADWKPLDWLRVSGGLRYEGSRLSLVSGSPFATGGAPPGAPVVKPYNDVIPSANVVFSPRSDFNVRAAYAFTLARPTFRELGPFLWFDTVRRANVTGNPDLVETRIHHADLRAEWFPSDGEVLAVSGFAKQFLDPIERVIISAASSNDFGYRNAAAATLLGIELEARVKLGRVTPALENVKVGANLSLISSRISLTNASIQTNAGRPLQGQSPYVANGNVTWEKPEWGTQVGVFYNVYGPRISEVGILQVPDIYEQPVHRLDVTVSQQLPANFQLKLSASNLLGQSVRFTQGDVEVLRTPPGLAFFASLGWTFNPGKEATQ
jgi:TonB-dependent receptor